VKHVSSAKEAPSAFGCFEEHPISSRDWLAVGDAKENDVNINTGTQGFMKDCATSAVNDFVDQKIGSLRMFTMKECCGNPNLISDFDLGKNLGFHRFSPQCTYIITRYYSKFQVGVKRIPKECPRSHYF